MGSMLYIVLGIKCTIYQETLYNLPRCLCSDIPNCNNCINIYNGTDLKTALYRSIELILLMLIYNQWEKPNVVAKTFAIVLSLCTYLNLLIMIIFPDWMFAAKDTFDSHLLGGNYNQIGSRLIFALTLTILCFRFSNGGL